MQSHYTSIRLSNYKKNGQKKNKKRIINSRVSGTNLLFSKCKELNIKPKTFITASAIGFYGLNAKGIKKEEDEKGNDWISKLVESWENSANKFKELGC